MAEGTPVTPTAPIMPTAPPASSMEQGSLPPSPTSPRAKRKSSTEHSLLMCDVCLEMYDNVQHIPKLLLCHHSFCESCLHKLIGTKDYFECPTCRQMTTMPSGGVSSLQTNFYITYMRDVLINNTVDQPMIVQSGEGCIKHSNQPLSFFCKQCNIAICRDCTVLDHKEVDGHAVQDTWDALNELHNTLTSEVNNARTIMKTVECYIQTLEGEVTNLYGAKEAAIKDIDSAFTQYITLLETRKQKLFLDVNAMYNDKVLILQRHAEDIQEKIINLNTTLDNMPTESTTDDSTLDTDNKENVPSYNPATTGISDLIIKRSKISDTTKHIEKLMSSHRVPTKNYIQFDSQQGVYGFQNALNKLGVLLSEKSLPSIVEISAHPATAGLPSQATVSVYDCKNTPLPKYAITADITDPWGDSIETSTLENDNGTYNVTYKPQVSGDHRIDVKFLGYIIKGAESVISVSSNNPVALIGQKGSEDGEFLCPRAVAIGNDDNIYVADTGNCRIQKFSPDGNFLSQFTVTSDGENNSTCDLAIDQKSNLIICTEIFAYGSSPSSGNTVKVYTSDGHLKHEHTNKTLKCALCVACNSKGGVIISDYIVNSLFMYNGNGTHVKKIGKYGAQSGQFNHPAFMCTGPHDYIIVTDTDNHRIQIFDDTGEFLFEFGTYGTGKGQFRQPFGVTTDSNHILVADSGNKRIQVFKMDGTFVSIIDSQGMPLNHARGISVTNDGHVLVADRDSHCIKKYKYM
ncbi:unnamed protein product [Owenia fusiformis]|uniref:Uncharacterized protein n=1 Tax=Owenia fusiformis TaxID=6347 RepID=A0A8J1URW3_OWEFU|nr:unnamed protein product [Owenia fusiformis]